MGNRIATAVPAVFAVVTAWYARKAFQKQSQEVSLLLEQNKRDADQRRRAQAARVFFGAPREGDPVSPYVKNASEFPVYSVDVWYFDPSAADAVGCGHPVRERRVSGREACAALRGRSLD